MYEKYTRQALPNKEYRELLGSAICVFNSNNAFVIENILRASPSLYSWYDLISKTSGQLKIPVKKTISKQSNDKIANKFSDIVNMRNRIMHSFQITAKNGEQILATLDKNTGKQILITKEYLLEFIAKNEEISDALYAFRKRHKKNELQHTFL